MVAVEELENGSSIRKGFLEGSVGDIVFSPVDDTIVVKIIGAHHLFLDFGLLKVFQVVRVCEVFNISDTSFEGIDNFVR